MGRSVVSKSVGNCGYGTCHRLAIGAYHHRHCISDADTCVPTLLQRDRHKHRWIVASVYGYGIHSDDNMWHCSIDIAACVAKEARYI